MFVFINKLIKYFRFDLSHINAPLEGVVEFTREWFEEELEVYFNNCKLYYDLFKGYPFPMQMKLRCDREIIDFSNNAADDIKFVFLAGGTCKIPFVQRWIEKQFPKAEIIIDGQIETVTATGAVIHALQVLNNEVQPYIIPIYHPTACSITKYPDKFEIEIYDIRTGKKSKDFKPIDKSIRNIVDELVKKLGSGIGIITITNDSDLKPSEQINMKDDFEENRKVVHLATKEELEFSNYLQLKVKYVIGEHIIWFKERRIIYLCECTEADDKGVTWKELEWKEHGSSKCIDLEYAVRMFHLEMNQVHVVFENSQKEIDSMYDSKLYNYSFKSINFIETVRSTEHEEPLFLARHLISDPKIPILVKVEKLSAKVSNLQSFAIEDWGFIHVPRRVKRYEPRRDIMGVDLGSTKCVLAVSKDKKIRIVNIDKNSPEEQPWIESVISFDKEKPIIGKRAMEVLETKSDHVIFYAKLLCSSDHRKRISNQSMWSFNYSLNDCEIPQLEIMTFEGLKEYSLAKVNSIFLERIVEAANENQNNQNSEDFVNKAVITIPRYFRYDGAPSHALFSVLEAATLAKVEIIDIIEETHADLLYYLSIKKYSRMIEPDMNIAIFDIGGGTCVCRIYRISENNKRLYATCFGDSSPCDDSDDKYSGRGVEDVIIDELESRIKKDSRESVKFKILKTAKKIKHELSAKERIE